MRAAVVTPLSGPLAGFGRAGAEALRLWARSAATVPRSAGRVDLSLHDSGPGVSAALAQALEDRPDLLFGPYGSGPAMAMARGTRRPVWNHGGATSRLSGFAHVVNVLSPAASYFDGALEMLHGAVSSVTVLHADTGFGRDVAAGARRRAAGLGLAVHEAGFEPGTAVRAVRDAPEADVLMVAAGFEDERSAGRILAERPWRACVLVGAGEEEVLAGPGRVREGLLGPAQWLAGDAWEPDEGPAGDWFVRRYEEQAGATPPYPAAQAFAAGLIAARCVRETGGCDDDALHAAAAGLSCTTMYGPFRLDESGTQVGHQVLTVQWQDGRRVVVWPPERVPGAGLRTYGGDHAFTPWFHRPDQG